MTIKTDTALERGKLVGCRHAYDDKEAYVLIIPVSGNSYQLTMQRITRGCLRIVKSMIWFTRWKALGFDLVPFCDGRSHILPRVLGPSRRQVIA
jgi:hypothetical protein